MYGYKNSLHNKKLDFSIAVSYMIVFFCSIHIIAVYVYFFKSLFDFTIQLILVRILILRDISLNHRAKGINLFPLYIVLTHVIELHNTQKKYKSITIDRLILELNY